MYDEAPRYSKVRILKKMKVLKLMILKNRWPFCTLHFNSEWNGISVCDCEMSHALMLSFAELQNRDNQVDFACFQFQSGSCNFNIKVTMKEFNYSVELIFAFKRSI